MTYDFTEDACECIFRNMTERARTMLKEDIAYFKNTKERLQNYLDASIQELQQSGSPSTQMQVNPLDVLSGIKDSAYVEGSGILEYELYNVPSGGSDDFERFVLDQYIPMLEKGHEEAVGIYRFNLDDVYRLGDNTEISDNVKRMMTEHQRNLSITRLQNHDGSTDFLFNCLTSAGKYEFYHIRAFKR
jgi:hypothetical protein